MKTPRKKVLLLEDDPNLGLILQEHLKLNGFAVDLLTDGEAGTASAVKNAFDICLVDVMMPRKDGFSFVRDLRKGGSTVPVIFLTAKAMREDRIEGFRLGADDYVTKPFSMEELLLRIEAVLRRTAHGEPAEEEPSPVAIGRYTFDPGTRELAMAGRKHRLTQREADLLALLCRKRNRIVDRSAALKELWGEDSYFNGRSMDVFLTRLRKYLKGDPLVAIMTVHGKGVKLSVRQR
jgi:DNA-binding response OmpR family regulator